MKIIVVVMLALSSAQAKSINYKSCPAGKNLVPYNHFHPVKSVFASASFSGNLSQVISKNEPDIIIHSIPTDLDDSPFLQDGFEIVYNPLTQKSFILSPEHADGTVAPIVSTLLNLPLENYGADTYSDEATGNLEGLPGGLTLMGSPMKDNGPSSFDPDKVLYMDPQGTIARHVDELFTVVPKLKKPQALTCPFVVFYSSGQAALEALKVLPEDAQLQVELSKKDEGYLKTYEVIKNCLEAFSHPMISGKAVTVAEALSCSPLLERLQQLESIRQGQINQLKPFLEKKLGCNVEFVGLPYFLLDGMSLSPNPVNALVLNKTVIIGSQGNMHLEKLITSKINAATGFKVDYADDHQFHFHGGNVHCLTNVQRSCL